MPFCRLLRWFVLPFSCHLVLRYRHHRTVSRSILPAAARILPQPACLPAAVSVLPPAFYWITCLPFYSDPAVLLPACLPAVSTVLPKPACHTAVPATGFSAFSVYGLPANSSYDRHITAAFTAPLPFAAFSTVRTAYRHASFAACLTRRQSLAPATAWFSFWFSCHHLPGSLLVSGFLLLLPAPSGFCHLVHLPAVSYKQFLCHNLHRFCIYGSFCLYVFWFLPFCAVPFCASAAPAYLPQFSARLLTPGFPRHTWILPFFLPAVLLPPYTVLVYFTTAWHCTVRTCCSAPAFVAFSACLPFCYWFRFARLLLGFTFCLSPAMDSTGTTLYTCHFVSCVSRTICCHHSWFTITWFLDSFYH